MDVWKVAQAAIGASHMLAKNYDGPVLSVDKGGNDVYVPIGILKSCTVTIRSAALQIVTLDQGVKWRAAVTRGTIQTVSGPLYYFDPNDHAVLESYRIRDMVMDWEIRFPALGSVTGLCQIAALEPVKRGCISEGADLGLQACGQIVWRDEPAAAFRSPSN